MIAHHSFIHVTVSRRRQRHWWRSVHVGQNNYCAGTVQCRSITRGGLGWNVTLPPLHKQNTLKVYYFLTENVSNREFESCWCYWIFLVKKKVHLNGVLHCTKICKKLNPSNYKQSVWLKVYGTICTFQSVRDLASDPSAPLFGGAIVIWDGQKEYHF